MKRILLVDDDESTRMICRRFFRKSAAGLVEVEEAQSGEEAIAALARGRFDCVLTDYRMGAATGIDVLVHALKAQPQARRVLMSGFADPSLVDAAKRHARLDAFIEKPLLTHEFDQALRDEVLTPLLGPAAPPEG